ncbi:uncharacterized protein LOC134216874 [Armigeres subalbatus]|uniref:uncharacterized protein LOC134216874 n=1 Tax=Armigeres subalbatus TaxID=124917 RepID=UPI002ED6AC60
MKLHKNIVLNLLLLLCLSTVLPECLAQEDETVTEALTTTNPTVVAEEVSDDLDSPTTTIPDETNGELNENGIAVTNILTAPCPTGYKLDQKGVCRKVSVF